MMQVRHLIAIYCYDFMFTPEDAGTAAHQASQIQKYYIGDEGAPDDETNFADMFFKGEGPFTNCLESHPDQTGQMMLNRNIFGITDNIIRTYALDHSRPNSLKMEFFLPEEMNLISYDMWRRKCLT